MPIREHRCEDSHNTEVLYTTFQKDSEGPKEIPCSVCGKPAERVDFSRTLEPHFYGEGFYKSSATKRHSYKLASDKGNENSLG